MRALHRFGAGIGEKDAVGEGRVDEPLAKRALSGNLEDVGDMPELFRLRLQRRHDVRMRVAEHVDRDAAHEVEVAGAVGRGQPSALASFEGKVDPLIGREQR